jgi:Zn-dependent protease with chaperone function
MTGVSIPARYFDGRTAAGHDVEAEFSAQGVAIRGETINVAWPARDLRVADRDGREIRLKSARDEAARLVIPASAEDQIWTVLPGLLSGEGERRRMTALIGVLVAGAAAVAGLVFFGAPAASGPLAERTPKDLEIQMGENVAGQINLFMKPCGDGDGLEGLTSVIDDMALKGDVGFPIRFQLVRNSAPNAFALPGGQVMATSGLLEAVGDDQEAFLAVMAHELGHVRARDSLKAIYRNAGAGVVLDIVTGGSGAAQQAVIIAGQLNQLRHTRKQETAADDAAAEILIASNLDPAALARAFDAILSAASPDGDEGDLPDWASSHPDTRARIEKAKARAKAGGPPPISADDWAAIKKACTGA